MTVIAWPNAAERRIERVDIQPYSPGQVELPFANAVGVSQFIQTGYGSWRGVTLIGAADPNPVTGAAIEAFFAGLDGGINTTEMPFHRETISDVVGVMRIAQNRFTLRTIPEGLSVGQYVRRARGMTLFNLYMIVAYDPATNQIQLWPNTPIDQGDSLVPATSIHVRARAPTSIDSLPRLRRGYGPWQFVWKEARS